MDWVLLGAGFWLGLSKVQSQAWRACTRCPSHVGCCLSMLFVLVALLAERVDANVMYIPSLTLRDRVLFCCLSVIRSPCCPDVDVDRPGHAFCLCHLSKLHFTLALVSCRLDGQANARALCWAAFLLTR